MRFNPSPPPANRCRPLLASIALFVLLSPFHAAGTEAALEVPVNNQEPLVALPVERQLWFHERLNARFTRAANTFVWVSDVEHVIDQVTKETYLADGEPKRYLCGETIPGGVDFELFPYHYYDKEEEEALGRKINYSLIAKNPGESEVAVAIAGMGTVRDWNHYQTWEGALRGDNATTFTLRPGETRVLWNAKALDGGLPWSAIVLGRADGELWVCDYAYLGDEDPGVADAAPQPNIAWPPSLLASFTRGTAKWNAADIELFPGQRDAEGHLPLSVVGDNVHSLAFGYSPGGPITNLCEYKIVQPTFVEDELVVRCGASGYAHKFFGGNYPIQYRFRLPLRNDTAVARQVRFHLCSNDRFGVDTFAGAWIEGRMLWRRVPILDKNEHWTLLRLTLPPGETRDIDWIVVPLGSRWGGMVGSLDSIPVAAN